VGIDHELQQQNIINNKTFSVYQHDLSSLYQEQVYVQPAADDNNKKALCIAFTSRQGAYQQLKSKVNERIEDAQTMLLSTDDADPKTFFCIIVPYKQTALLHEIVQETIPENIEKFIEKALVGIERYQQRPRNVFNLHTHLSIFSRIFDNQRGVSRAAIYQSALQNDALSPQQKLTILYAILGSHDGETLKGDVAEAILGDGLRNVDAAKSSVERTLRLLNANIAEANHQLAAIYSVANHPPKHLPANPSELLAQTWQNNDQNALNS